MISRFNLRVYGLWIQDNAILVCDESEKGMSFTKFPGGGLEFGEGLTEGLERELKEELDIRTDALTHFYTTSFFQQSAFNPRDQLISVYYTVTTSDVLKQMHTTENRNGKDYHIDLRWIPLDRLSAADLTFPIDKLVAEMLINGTR